jgi:hypothetical protein
VRAVASAAVAILSVGLAGCFTSETPLLNDANSVAPYAKIAFRDEHSSDLTTLAREGKAYVSDTSDGRVTMRFMPTDRSDWFVAQASGPGVTADKIDLFYAVLRIDLANHRAYAFKSIGDTSDVGPGLRACGDGICIDDVAAYVTRAEASADAGHAADATYVIDVE